ncbi:hypothetical protein HUW63_37220 [Myxococcus sp. AM001]|uniref:hypothetical protein n=1 Tax=Myxococcus vastator TaxID=2709664 RepID=UPI0013D39832|nr:hypothetical protein [Myxococcus vastator]NVJ10824.1 hypothetical protein [Myxococcus sp. AM001]
MMPLEEFIQQLANENEAFFSAQPAWAKTYWAEKMSLESTIQALRMRYWNEYVGAEVIARFMLRVENPTIKMMVGRQVGDEAKHAFYVRKRIEELGGSLGDPLPEQLAFYETLDNFRYPEEFFSAQQFTVETQSLKRNEQALHNFDSETADMFRKHINEDEVFHVRLGHTGLKFYCVTSEAQARARTAAAVIRERHVAMSLANARILQSRGLMQS